LKKKNEQERVDIKISAMKLEGGDIFNDGLVIYLFIFVSYNIKHTIESER
jgi:hypothetical protein